jgi:hypothetical protein
MRKGFSLPVIRQSLHCVLAEFGYVVPMYATAQIAIDFVAKVFGVEKIALVFFKM